MNQNLDDRKPFKPIYLRQIWQYRFLISFGLVVLLQMSLFLPLAYCLLLEFVALVFWCLAIFYFYEYKRLIDFSDFYLDAQGVHYFDGENKVSIAYSQIEITFLYYSSLDKMKGSATFCLRLVDGRVLRFAGFTGADQMLSCYGHFAKKKDQSWVKKEY